MPNAHNRRWSFVKGLLCGLLLANAGWLWNFADIHGGQHASSPDGRFSLGIMATLYPHGREPYSVRLRRTTDDKNIAQWNIQFSDGPKTQPLRGVERVIHWDPNSQWVDVAIAGQPAMRISMP